MNNAFNFNLGTIITVFYSPLSREPRKLIDGVKKETKIIYDARDMNLVKEIRDMEHWNGISIEDNDYY